MCGFFAGTSIFRQLTISVNVSVNGLLSLYMAK